ncbi:MAG: amino acid carrier protein, partial [Owenweeksia sp.]
MFRITLCLLGIFISSLSMAGSDPLAIDITIENPTHKINDGNAQVEVRGGTPPYHYYWSSTGTDTVSTKCFGLTEGISHSVTVMDSEGNKVEKSFEIPTQALAESFNGTFKPIV